MNIARFYEFRASLRLLALLPLRFSLPRKLIITLLLACLVVSGCASAHSVTAPVPAHLTVYVSASSSLSTLTALRAQDGSIRWSHTQLVNDLLLDNGVLYGTLSETLSNTNTIGSWRASDGKSRWQVSLHARWLGWTISQGIMYVIALQGQDGAKGTLVVEALRASDGSSLWTTPLIDDTAYNILPLTICTENAHVVVATIDSIIALRLLDGQLSWRLSIPSLNVACSQGSQDTVFAVDRASSQILALRSTNGAQRWAYKPIGLSIFPTSLALVPTLAEVGNLLYFVADNSPANETTQIFALQASAGTLVWQSKPFARGSSLATPNTIYVIADKQLIALKSDTGTVLWQLSHSDPLAQMTIAQDIIVATSCKDSVYFGGCDIFAVDAHTGASYWDESIDAMRGSFALAVG